MGTSEKNQEQFLKAMKFRHACKLFDANRKIGKKERDYILEVGRLSPSSMGVEPWDFVVVEYLEGKKKLQEACKNQAQVSTASFDVIVLVKIDDMNPQSNYIDMITDRYGENKEKRRVYYTDFYNRKFKNASEIKNWGTTQCHLAAANMMTAAAFIGIDSCPIGGFEAEKVKNLFSSGLKLSSTNNSSSISKRKTVSGKEFIQGKEVALVICFGYRTKEQPEKKRRKFQDIAHLVRI